MANLLLLLARSLVGIGLTASLISAGIFKVRFGAGRKWARAAKSRFQQEPLERFLSVDIYGSITWQIIIIIIIISTLCLKFEILNALHDFV